MVQDGVKMTNSIRSKLGRNSVELWYKIRLREAKMTWWEQVWFWANILIAAIILGYFVLQFGSDSVGNCWDKYQTESQAIKMCENE